MKRKNITKEQFVDFLLAMRSKVEEEVIKFFKDDLGYKGDEKKLQYEAMIFALWLTTLSTPLDNNKIKDMLHSAFSWKYWGVKNNESLFEQIDKRYKNYYEAFNMWQKNPQSGHMIGSVMIEIIKNQNPNFSLKETLPLIGGMESFQAFILFGELFKTMLQSIKDLKKDFRLDHIIG